MSVVPFLSQSRWVRSQVLFPQLEEKRAEETLRESVLILTQNIWSNMSHLTVLPVNISRKTHFALNYYSCCQCWSVEPSGSITCAFNCLHNKMLKKPNYFRLCTLLGVASEMTISHPFLDVIKNILWSAKPVFIKITVSCGIRKHWHFTCTTNVSYFYPHAGEKGCAVYVGVLN